MSIIEEGDEQRVRMATLAIVGGHSVNGVAALHSEILKKDLFKDFYEMSPEKFSNKTNGITQRRWLLKSNPALSKLITGAIGDGWITNLYELKKLVPLAGDPAFMLPTLAEDRGFEPLRACTQHAFQACAIGH